MDIDFDSAACPGCGTYVAFGHSRTCAVYRELVAAIPAGK